MPGARPRSRLAALRAFAALSGLASARSATATLVLFAMPIFVTGFVGLALRGYTTPALVVGVHDPGASADAGRLVRALEADPFLRIRRYDDTEKMRLAVYRGRLHGGLLVPPGWRADQPLETYVSKAGSGATVLRAILDRELARLARPDAPSATLRVVDGETLASPPVGYQYTAPSNLVLFLMMTAILGSGGLAALRRSGIGRRLLASPATPGELALALAVGPFQIMAVQSTFLIAVGGLAFGVAWGSPAGVLLVTGALILFGVGATLCLGTLFRTDAQVTAFGPFVGILLGMLGGCMWPLEVVPKAVASFGRLFPTAWAMDAYLALVFGHAPWHAVLPDVGKLVLAAAALGALAIFRMRRELGRA
jgi:ABC-2 type transport system permease protein